MTIIEIGSLAEFMACVPSEPLDSGLTPPRAADFAVYRTTYTSPARYWWLACDAKASAGQRRKGHFWQTSGQSALSERYTGQRAGRPKKV
jgi:hypothetical protein